MKLGYLGLGRMGKNMVLRLLEQGIEVVAWNRSSEPLSEVVSAGAVGASSVDELISQLEIPRTVWLMLPAGEVTDEILNKIIDKLSPGDLVIDGGNSFYKDSIRRNKLLSSRGVHFMDIGVSGGPDGARMGACLMIGGSKEDFERIIEIVKAASSPDAYQYLGSIGAGHFAKMVHNGIEYGMMEAIGEGSAILKNSEFNYDFVKLFDLYNHGSVIASSLVGWAKEAFKEDLELAQTSSVIGSGGSEKRIPAEADWTVDIAKRMQIDVPVIEDAIRVRVNSQSDLENSPAGFRNKVISAMRGQFGQHKVKKD